MNVLAIAEQRDGQFRKVTFEAVSEGRRLADQLGGTLSALVMGGGIEGAAAELAIYGAEKILLVDHAELADYRTDTYTSAAVDAIQREAPAMVVLGASMQGKDLSARLSARLDAALATDCIQVDIDNGDAVVTRPMYGGKVLAKVALSGQPQLIGIRPNAMPIAENAGAGIIEKLDHQPEASLYQVIEQKLETGKIELTEADIVVSGGRGMGGSDYRVVEELAASLGAAVGASRSAVDEGWRPHADQVGQTGKVVSPNLYIACGISGAIQHLAGMSSSKVIVAINKDGEAPILAKADYSVVGDLFEIVPLLTEEIKKMQG